MVVAANGMNETSLEGVLTYYDSGYRHWREFPSGGRHVHGDTKCTCPVLNAPRADTPFCLEYPPEGFSPRADTRDKNGVFVPRAFKQGWCTCNFTKSGPSG
jgi:hypothetical protein